LVVVFVRIVLHPINAGRAFSESDVGKLVEQLLVSWKRKAMFTEEQVDGGGESSY
jgi:hypothetical protein